MNELNLSNSEPPILTSLHKQFSTERNGPKQSDILKVNTYFFFIIIYLMTLSQGINVTIQYDSLNSLSKRVIKIGFNH